MIPADALPADRRDLDAFLAHLRRSGVRFSVAADLRHDPDQGGHPHATPTDSTLFAVPGLPPIREARSGRIGSDHATWSVAADLASRELVTSGTTFWDIGTGTGLLALAADALGARRVIATDVDEHAIVTAAANTQHAGAAVQLFTGSLLDAVPSSEPPADLVTANLPHKPRRRGAQLPLAEDGGDEGDALVTPFFEQAAARLLPGGRVLFFQHSLPHPRNLVRTSEDFDLRLLSWKRRFLAHGEYGDLQNWFAERARDGRSYLAETAGLRFMVACVWLATRR